ncbi:MAG: hypothetical protein AAFR23_08910, partial [Pseudomonadota bacterium]
MIDPTTMATRVSDTSMRLKLSDVRATAQSWLHAVWHATDQRAETQRAAMIAFSVRVGSAALLYLSQI